MPKSNFTSSLVIISLSIPIIVSTTALLTYTWYRYYIVRKSKVLRRKSVITDAGDIVVLTGDIISIQDEVDLVRSPSAGAISVFLGTTRDVFEGRRVAQLSYEAYEDMALDSMKDIATKIRQQWPVVRIVIAHKLGECPVGDISVLIAVASAHREEAIAATRFGINELKATVPIWKKEIYEDGASTWKQNAEWLRDTSDEDTADDRRDSI